jgi:hypothetical protein
MRIPGAALLLSAYVPSGPLAFDWVGQHAPESSRHSTSGSFPFSRPQPAAISALLAGRICSANVGHVGEALTVHAVASFHGFLSGTPGECGRFQVGLCGG